MRSLVGRGLLAVLLVAAFLSTAGLAPAVIGDDRAFAAAAPAAEHDPHDLSHNNPTPNLEKAEEWKFDLAIYSLVVFLLLLGILLKFAWGPIVAALQQREGNIARWLEEAEQSAAESRAKLAEYQRQLETANKEAGEIVARARQAAQDSADKIVADAKAAAQRQTAQAVAEIELAKNEALGQVTEKSVDIALALAGDIVRKQLGRDEHAALIRDALERFPSVN